MPIYDYNGSTSTEIGRVYDYNGSTSTEMSKVYDYNGSTSSEVFSAEANLFPGTDTYAGGWSVSRSGDNGTYVDSTTISARATTTYTNGKVYSTSKIDLTNFASLVFTVTNYSKTGNATLACGIKATYSDVYLPADFLSCVQPNANGDFTLDVSSRNGEYYVICAAWGSTGNSRMDITKIATT